MGEDTHRFGDAVYPHTVGLGCPPGCRTCRSSGKSLALAKPAKPALTPKSAEVQHWFLEKHRGPLVHGGFWIAFVFCVFLVLFVCS